MIASVSSASDQAWPAKRARAAGSSSPITYETTTRSACAAAAADVAHHPFGLPKRLRPVRGKRLPCPHHLGLCLDEGHRRDPGPGIDRGPGRDAGPCSEIEDRGRRPAGPGDLDLTEDLRRRREGRRRAGREVGGDVASRAARRGRRESRRRGSVRELAGDTLELTAVSGADDLVDACLQRVWKRHSRIVAWPGGSRASRR